MNFLIATLGVFLQLVDVINSVELTFELPDQAKECFYMEVGKNKTAVIEYQVSFLWKIFKKIQC